MGEAARELAPGGHPLGLQQAFFLRGQRSRHVVKGDGQLANFIDSADFDARVPPTGSHFAGAFGKFLDGLGDARGNPEDRKSTRLNSSHVAISYAVFCLKKKNESGNES